MQLPCESPWLTCGVLAGSKDFEARSGNGGDRVITAFQSGPEGVEVPVLDRDHTVTVTTNGGVSTVW